MAPSRPPPTESQLKQSDEWKQKGNVAFRAKNFTEAFASYTEAISLNPQSQTLYSNRSAALLSLGRLPLALNDAKRAVELDPKWAKGYRRKASVLDAMKRFREALVVYEEAIVVTRADPSLSDEQKKKEEAEVKKLMIALNKKLNAKPAHPAVLLVPRDQYRAPGLLIVRESERRVQQGEQFGLWPPIGSCFRRLWIAEMQFHNALIHLNEFNTVEMPVSGMPGPQQVIFGRLQTLEELTTAMIEDIRVGRLDMESLGKLNLCLQLEQQRRNAIGPNITPKEAIAEYARRLTEPPSGRSLPEFARSGGSGSVLASGWDYVRPALQLSIRSSLMGAFLKSVLAEDDNGTPEFRRCVELIEEARALWPDVDGSMRGRSLEETFLRQVKVHLGESLMVGYSRLPKDSPSSERTKILDEIISIGEWIVRSFENKPHPPEEQRLIDPAGGSRWWMLYYTHYSAPLAKAHILIAFGNLSYGTDIDTVALDSKETGKRGPLASSPTRLGISAIHFTKAAAWMPMDEPERANALWWAIFAMVRRGGYYLADFEVLRDMATKCPGYFTPFFPLDCIPDNHAGKHAAAEVLGTTVGGGGGLLALTEVMRDVWKERMEKWGEQKELMGADKIWEDVEPELKVNWSEVWKENQEEDFKTFMG
ncbi:hypothetical protein FN846DRAFT_783928 [Sphaerosporella brunnea]|uniref:TPR-like protein n=1 Tax=Sphaerosporella brunnea TaxID=1250544 RepID=A0A5J5ELX2_9PEZI|nr:hypothetical protein FN846DRAFT_783912 [Sphaerosporella brunnea]KAA8896197.1 hypothetical protein FN846DRAFT_783928 [Sphaerosporella brunnea]